ncbi:hypothetical protein [Hyphomonas johnsonii]|uniref:TM2 domain-containing protein n=1 Tax=Hyphomonas johnsonii MHS-2 TaxID=1280950 RepID=A0A059FHD0_9PROT|nr:hypothetical protein [Hyphomonas johnsonii]KCZ90025.1 hypothetical protein HJO_13786 [Hyphomonas johnsonii MHS-2]
MKALAIILNILMPGVGSFVIGKVGQGIGQILIWAIGLTLCFTVVGAIIGIPMMLGAWIWGIVIASNSQPQTVQVTVNNSGLTNSETTTTSL